MTKEIFTQYLNDEQLEILYSNNKVNLVFAGAGTGKTRTILYKIIYILTEHSPDLYQFFITTFTNKAADELRERIGSQFGNRKVFFPYLGTFHSLCVRILRKYGDKIGLKRDFSIYDENDSVRIIKKVIPEDIVKSFKAENLLKIFEFYKENHYETGEKIFSGLEKYYEIYEKTLREYNAMDFADLLEKTIKLFTENKEVLMDFTKHIKYVFVDEFQDTNLAQYRILKLLWEGIEKQHNDPYLMVVGDENQSIYGFRNARVENILNFPKDFKGTMVYTLSKNYRSTKEILNVAKYLAYENPYKTEHLISANNISGDKVKYAILKDDNSEATYIISEIKKLIQNGIQHKEIAVFFRTNFQIRLLERYFKEAKLPYIIVGAQKFYDRMEIKDVLSYLKFLINYDDIISFIRLIKVPKRGIGNVAIEKILKIKKDLNDWEKVLKYIKENKILSKKQIEQLENLFGILNKYKKSKKEPHKIVENLIEDIGYSEYLLNFDEETYDFRWDNINFLLNEIKRLEGEGLKTLFDIIERLSLYSSMDTWQKDRSINLMTLHLSKGLEFDAVFISGVEESIIPHLRSQSEKELEDEQRLLYVGITRARKYLYLTRALRRYQYGKDPHLNMESQFIQMIPKEELDIYEENSFRNLFYQAHKKDLVIPNNKNTKKESPSGMKFKKGDKVKHNKYGVGLVIDSYNDGVYKKVEVRFYKYGRKTIIEDFLERT